MAHKPGTVPVYATAFIIIGALFGAGFASGQETLKFFCSYGSFGVFGLAVCFVLYVALGLMTYELCRNSSETKMEDIVAPVDNIIIKKMIWIVMMFSFFVITTALLAAGDSLFMTQLNFPKGTGGLIITVLVVVTNLVGFEGIRRVLPLVVPIMLAAAITVGILIVLKGDRVPHTDPSQYGSPLAPFWLLGAVLYLAYNFIAVIPVLTALPRIKEQRYRTNVGMTFGFAGICGFGFLLYKSIMTNLDGAGTQDVPMVFLAGDLSHALGMVYSLLMVIAIYSAAANSLYGLTRDVSGNNDKARRILIIVFAALTYVVSLKGFSFLVTFGYPVEGYAAIAVVICIVLSFIRLKAGRLFGKSL